MNSALLITSFIMLIAPLFVANRYRFFTFVISPCISFASLIMLFVCYCERADSAYFSIFNIIFKISSIYELLLCITIHAILTIVQYTFLKLHEEDVKTQILFNIFVCIMQCIILCNNIFVLYACIETLSLISAILVSYGKHNEKIETDSTITFIFNKIASILFLCGICIIYNVTGSTIVSDTVGCIPLRAGVLVLIACIIKSAQFPFATWLISACRANIFASVLIHSSTIVGVGFVILSKFGFLFGDYQILQTILIAICSISATIACLFAIFETDIKKIMAYSTIASMGLILIVCGYCHNVVASLYFICHAFFKSALFIAISYIVLCYKGETSILVLSTKSMPKIMDAVFVAFLSSIGLPFVSFFGKVPLFDVLIEERHYFVCLNSVLVSIFLIICFMRVMYKLQNNEQKLESPPKQYTTLFFIFMFIACILSFSAWTAYQFNTDATYWRDIATTYDAMDYIKATIFESIQIIIAYNIFNIANKYIKDISFDVNIVHNFIQHIFLQILKYIFNINNWLYNTVCNTCFDFISNIGNKIANVHCSDITLQLKIMILFLATIIYAIVVLM